MLSNHTLLVTQPEAAIRDKALRQLITSRRNKDGRADSTFFFPKEDGLWNAINGMLHVPNRRHRAFPHHMCSLPVRPG